MDARRRAGAAGTNSNRNNNNEAKNKKPHVPSKPQHLTGSKNHSSPTPFSKDVVTPKAWSHTKFSFGQGDNKSSSVVSTPKWRPVQKVMQKQSSIKESSEHAKFKPYQENSRVKAAAESLREEEVVAKDKLEVVAPNASDPVDGDDDPQRGFGSLKRMWSAKAKTPTAKQGFKFSVGNLSPISNKSEVESPEKSLADEDGKSTKNGTVYRSTSSSSDGSVRTASFKNKQATWHYVTANPAATFSADSLPSKIELNEPQTLPPQTRKFDHKILAPKPFQSSFDESGTSLRTRSNIKESKNRRVSSRSSRKSRHSRRHEDLSSSDSKSESDGDSEEAEMRIARKRGTLVTRFDSRGNKYKVNPRTGEVCYVDDEVKEQSAERNARGVFQRMNAVSSEGTSIADPNSDSKERKSSASSREEIPPPLLPRERLSHRTDGSVVPPSRTNITKSVTATSMYSDKRVYSPPFTGGSLSPEAAIPPPLLPRGEIVDDTNNMDYTPMSGAEIPIHDKGSIGSSISLNSVLDQSNYEPMHEKGRSITSSFADEDDAFVYSTAINPPTLKPRASIREYHEIDPDAEDGIDASSSSIPPPPANDPPPLPGSSRFESHPSQNNQPPPDSPPPLPPMNPGQKKLNYIDVEFRSHGNRGSKDKRISAKTNYTDVMVGGTRKVENDTKRGKSIKEVLMSVISTAKTPDGYASEGDAISKNNDERTTDFSKERNKLKRLSGRILRKKKQKSKNTSRESSEYEPEQKHENINVGVYGSTTNLSTTSSESSRSLSQMVASNSGSSGDGQIRRHVLNVDRRQSCEPAVTQLPPKLSQKSRSEVHLPSPMSTSKSTENTHSPVLPLSAESTLKKKQRDRKSSKDVSGSPLSVAPRLESHLHQRQGRPNILPSSSRRTSEPPPMDYLDMSAADTSNRTSYNAEISVSGTSKNRAHTFVELQGDYAYADKLSPNLPTDAPPFPPVGGVKLPLPPPTLREPVELPPDPMRDTKPDRFKKRLKSQEPSYTAAGNSKFYPVETTSGDDPIYDIVSPDSKVTPSVVVPLSPSAKSKLLESEPLYQVYRSRTLSHASMRVRRRQSNKTVNSSKSNSTSVAQGDDMWQSDLMTDDAGSTTLWREVKEVVESRIGEDLTNEEMKLQQAQFEVVTSQASYMRSLNILIDHFMHDSVMKDVGVLPKKQKKELFSNIVDVRKIEQGFLQEIEQHFWSKLYLTEIAKIAERYASADFEVYVRYVQNQVYQDRVLTDLQRHNDRFAIELGRLESSPFCNKLPLLSFLLLPMQRVTRLPLLISAIVNQADSAGDDEAYKAAKQALVVVNKLVKKCNEGARKMQQTEQLAEIAKELKFANNVKTYALVSQSRSLVKKGEMSATMIVENRKPKTMKLWLFLFTDVLLIAKKKMFPDSVSGARYEVIDWAKRAMLFVNERAVSENEIFLVLLENCNLKRVELTLTPVSLNELSRWTDALHPQHAGETEDSIYESWDCPQYQCIDPYSALQPDELTLDVGDVMRVLKKTADGWLEGERLRDNESGWFPAENCEEIEDEHVRARNLKNLYRIIPQVDLSL